MSFGGSSEIETRANVTENEIFKCNIHWEEVVCPVCLEVPHNAVLLQCSSYTSGCRPFICDTDHSLSNCLERFRSAYGLEVFSESSLSEIEGPNNHMHLILTDKNGLPSCPLCRGTVTGWVCNHEVRKYMNMQIRCCAVDNCTYIGNCQDLQTHAKLNHFNARPSAIDPKRKLEWDNLQESSEIIDVLSTINSEVPNGMFVGDYVVEYEDDDTEDEFEDFPGDEGNCWTSCLLYHVFDNFITSRSGRRLRDEATMDYHVSQYDTLVMSENSQSSATIAEQQFDETDEEATDSDGANDGGSTHSSLRRRRLMSSRRFHQSHTARNGC